jgi:hypothetical protein
VCVALCLTVTGSHALVFITTVDGLPMGHWSPANNISRTIPLSPQDLQALTDEYRLQQGVPATSLVYMVPQGKSDGGVNGGEKAQPYPARAHAQSFSDTPATHTHTHTHTLSPTHPQHIHIHTHTYIHTYTYTLP